MALSGEGKEGSAAATEKASFSSGGNSRVSSSAYIEEELTGTDLADTVSSGEAEAVSSVQNGDTVAERPPDEDTLLKGFVEVTNSSEETARQMLEACNWDLQYAVSLHLAGQDLDETPLLSQSMAMHSGLSHDAERPLLRSPPPESGPRSLSSSASTGDIDADHRTAGGLHRRRPAQQEEEAQETPSSRSRSEGGGLYWLLAKVSDSWCGVVCRFLSSLCVAVLRSVVTLGSTALRFAGTFLSGSAAEWRDRGSSRSSSVGRFESYFDTTYSTLHPTFWKGTFAQAVRECRQGGKLLVVYLHNDHARDTHHFCTKIFAEDIVIDMLNCTDNFLLWCEDATRYEGHEVSVTMKARRYPHVSILLPAAGSAHGTAGTLISSDSFTSANVQRIAVLEPATSVDELVTILTQCIDQIDSYREIIFSRQKQHESDRMLREEQDREYEEAQRADAARRLKQQQEAQRKAEEERQKKALMEKRRILLEKRKEAEVTALARRKELAKKFRDEDLRRSECPLAAADVARICLRLPHGRVRFDRKFHRNDTLHTLYEWAETLGVSSEDANTSHWSVDIPLEFQLSVPISGTKLHNERHRTLGETGLFPNALVLLTSLCDDEDDEF